MCGGYFILGASFIHLLLVFIASVLSFSCPFSEHDPCSCSQPPDDLTATCDGVTASQLSIMMDRLRNFRHLPVSHLVVLRANLTAVQSGIFDQLTLKSILIESSILSVSTAELFSGVGDSLEDLQFRWCLLQFPLSRWTLGPLPRLQRLAVTHSILPSVPANLLHTAANKLRSIYFYGDGISEVESGAFLTAFSVQMIVLNNNMIKTIRRSVLPRPAHDLQQLHLRDNQLEHLAPSMWEDMPSLRLVDLSANRLHILSEATWRPLWARLTDIYLQGNPLHCDCDIRWMIQEEQKLNKSQKFARFVYGSCASPDYLGYKPLENLTVFDLPC